MREVKKLIEEFAPTDCNVLILGPSGTGKEPVARLIHFYSMRSGGPFVPVNCAGIPENLIEGELFGWVKGAFTGATTNRKGHFETADHGTIFLDEIGDMPIYLQTKLLRVLQDKIITRIGESQGTTIDCRVVAATNTELKTALIEKKFREDLYYRLAVGIINVPPLSDRTVDIPLLVKHFLVKHTALLYGAENPVPGISGEAMRAIEQHHFPGNVRELENVIERALVHSKGEQICLEHLQDLSKTVREEAKEDFAALKPHPVTSRLLEAVRSIQTSFKITSAENIARYLTEKGRREFSRKDFAVFLNGPKEHDANTDSYGTAGRFIKALVAKGALIHNGERADKSRFWVAKDYLISEETLTDLARPEDAVPDDMAPRKGSKEAHFSVQSGLPAEAPMHSVSTELVLSITPLPMAEESSNAILKRVKEDDAEPQQEMDDQKRRRETVKDEKQQEQAIAVNIQSEALHIEDITQKNKREGHVEQKIGENIIAKSVVFKNIKQEAE